MTTSIFAPTQEHEMLRLLARRFASEELEPSAALRDQQEQFDPQLISKLGALGLLGITADESYGGGGMDSVAAVLVHEELSFADPGFTLAYLAHSMLCINNINNNGSDEQKRRYLPKLCSGEHIGAMAMSEPEIGTDVLGMGTRANRNEQGYTIQGRKMWITNGVLDDDAKPADIVFLYAKTSQGDAKNSISSFIVEAGTPGYSVGQKLKHKLGMRASNTAELVFSDCLLSSSQLVGGEGDSMLHMMKNLELERLTLAAMSLGIARRCLVVMNSYARERMAFGRPIAHFGQIQKHIAESYAKYKACRAYVYQVANYSAHGRIDSDGVKLVSSTVAKEIADSAIQVLGGYGYMGEYTVERFWRDAKLLEIGGGTLEAHQKNICEDLGKRPKAIFD